MRRLQGVLGTGLAPSLELIPDVVDATKVWDMRVAALRWATCVVGDYFVALLCNMREWSSGVQLVEL